MSNLSFPLLLRVSTPTQSSLTFCEATPRDLKRWISTLPKANLGEMARQLYQGLSELNQLLTSNENRLQLLEMLRPEVYFVCKHLERHFLNQAIVLDERPRKVANLCQALQNHLATGYKLIISSIAPRFGKEHTALLTTALQRAAHCLTGPLIRASQLYCPVQDGLWLELHQIYQIARQYRLHQTPVNDPQASHVRTLSTEQTYIIALMMACARCNQMRQPNIGKLGEVLEAWSSMVRLQTGNQEGSLFALDPGLDKPPLYASLFGEQALAGLLGINPLPLSTALQRYLELPAEQRSQSGLEVPPGVSTDLIQHLAAAWGDFAGRTFQRMEGHGSLKICIGMSAVHYYLAGKKSFSEQMQVPAMQAPDFSLKIAGQNSDDPWAQNFNNQPGTSSSAFLPMEEIAYSSADAESDANNAQQDFPTFTLSIVNHSPGGYCLAWQKQVPTQLQAGELVGVQDENSKSWSIAIVRWVRQVRSGGTQMGIELIAPFAQPCGMQLIREEQNSQYLRTLMLPEVRAMSKPAMVLAPRLPFKEDSKVTLNISGEQKAAVLKTRHVASASYNQFEYQVFEAPKSAARGSPRGGEEFESLWGSL